MKPSKVISWGATIFLGLTVAYPPTTIAVANATQGKVQLPGAASFGAKGVKDFLAIKDQKDKYLLAATAITEGKAGNVKSQVDTAVAMANRAQTGKWGDEAKKVILAPGQFEATWRWGLNNIQDRQSAIEGIMKARGYNSAAPAENELNQFLDALSNPEILKDSVQHLQGATDYRGPAPNTVQKPGDFQREVGDNFYLPPGDPDATVTKQEGQTLVQRAMDFLGGS